MGVAWAFKSVQEAGLANRLAMQEACRAYPVGFKSPAVASFNADVASV
jgi:hypothetical protein